MKLVRWPIEPLEQDRRGLEDRLLVGAPAVGRRLSGVIDRLPLGSRARKALISHALRTGLAAVSRGDYGRLLVAYDPQAEMHSGAEWAALDFEPVYRGHGGIRRMLERLNEGFTSSRWEPREVIDAGGGNFVCRMILVGVGRGSGAATSMEQWHVYRVEGGLVVRQAFLGTEEEALAALADATGSTG